MSELIANPWDMFFYYGLHPLEEETSYDLHEFLFSYTRELFYFRLGSGGVYSYENYPIGYSFFMLKYKLAYALSYRNTYVSNDINTGKDRRIAISQDTIKISSPGVGEVDIVIGYVLLSSLQAKIENFMSGRS